MKHRYRTIRSSGSGISKDKGSKHIGHAIHAKTEEEINAFLDGLRKEHHSARHVCYAWRLGYQGEMHRANDDGEPSNSAGPPILGQIEKYNLTFVCVAVVRYFGGTKLGVSGLIQAYRTAAMLAIEDAEIVEKQLLAHYRIHFGYDRMSEVMLAIRVHGWEESDQDFTTDCRLTVSLLPHRKEEVERAFEPFNDIRAEYLGIY